MNRVDRLTAMLLYLQGGKRTAGEIARRFEVSRRTILRDIDAPGGDGNPDCGGTRLYWRLLPTT